MSLTFIDIKFIAPEKSPTASCGMINKKSNQYKTQYLIESRSGIFLSYRTSITYNIDSCGWCS